MRFPCNLTNDNLQRFTMSPIRETTYTIFISVALCFFSFLVCAEQQVAIAIHGGAGTLSKTAMTKEKQLRYEAELEHAIKVGYALLKSGASGEQAIIKTLQILEASPLFNAGVGAVYNFDEEHELDASIMLGQSRQAGAVAGVKRIKSPIEAAAAVMNQSEHVMLSGIGAEQFAEKIGIEMVDNRFFNTPERKEALMKVKQRMALSANRFDERMEAEKMGTVGAVVLDRFGNIAAGTSTGGMTAKRFGRVGDSPIIGAGTFADNESCAVSATGHGEYFIRYNVAADICARVKYEKLSVDDAANKVVNDVLVKAGGSGGVIAIDRKGNITMPFNTSGMYRASIDVEGNVEVAIFK